MKQRRITSEGQASLAALSAIAEKIRPPFVIVLGSPREVVQLLTQFPHEGTVCYQMDLYQANRLEEEIRTAGLSAQVITAPDLWDLPTDFQTALYPAPKGGERMLKLDMIEQAFHVLRPRGLLVVSSPYEREQFFPTALKKIFGRVHAPPGGQGGLLWCRREGERPRRRHEVTFQARMDRDVSLRFLSRPGVFSYGRFDDGAHALVETMHIEPGDKVLDVGCGCGTNGIWASKLSGPDGLTVLIDSNVRSVALAELNARANGLTSFHTVASRQVDGLPVTNFQVALANPPYYAQLTIAQLFIDRCRVLLGPGGRFYLVTKQPDQVGPLMADAFARTEVVQRRGYLVLCATSS
jgi:16S rRNA (guanine1207-N2)-methyltransferase